MNQRELLFALIYLLMVSIVFSQSVDNNIKINKKDKTFLKKSILPISLIVSGILINNSSFERNLQKDVRNLVGNDFYSPIDDYTRYAPIIELYAADIIGLKAKNHWFDQTKNLTMSIIITNFITYRLKISTKKERPNSTPDLPSFKSFPSGHTSLAFANASVLYQEFIDTSPVLAYSGYAFAVTTGSFRILNNAHFLSDVLVGAGIGILVTELIYHFEPIKWNPFKKKDNITLVPKIGRNDIGKENYGFYLSLRF